MMESNPSKAGPKGALEDDVRGDKQPGSSGPPGNEGNNTRRDFVQLPKDKKRDRDKDEDVPTHNTSIRNV